MAKYYLILCWICLHLTNSNGLPHRAKLSNLLKVSTKSCTDDFVCPILLPNDTACNGPTDCLYPYEPNCHKFIQCDASGNKTVHECAAADQLIWNDDTKQCDYPENTECNQCSPDDTDPDPDPVSPSTSTSTTSTSTTPSEEDPDPELPTTTPSEEDSDTELPTTTPSEEDSDTESTTPSNCGTEEPDPDDGLNLDQLCTGCVGFRRLIAYPNPKINKRFIECYGGSDNDVNSVKSCSPGLLFNSAILSCDYGGLVSPNGPQMFM